MSFWTDPTDIPHCSEERRHEMAAIFARGLVRWQGRRSRSALSCQIPQESSTIGLALSPSVFFFALVFFIAIDVLLGQMFRSCGRAHARPG